MAYSFAFVPFTEVSGRKSVKNAVCIGCQLKWMLIKNGWTDIHNNWQDKSRMGHRTVAQAQCKTSLKGWILKTSTRDKKTRIVSRETSALNAMPRSRKFRMSLFSGSLYQINHKWTPRVLNNESAFSQVPPFLSCVIFPLVSCVHWKLEHPGHLSHEVSNTWGEMRPTHSTLRN